jgi:hypothetical protein
LSILWGWLRLNKLFKETNQLSCSWVVLIYS